LLARAAAFVVVEPAQQRGQSSEQPGGQVGSSQQSTAFLTLPFAFAVSPKAGQ
jgi:hypothetical protein